MFKKVVVMGVAGLLAAVVGTGVATAATTADSGPASLNCRAANGGWAAMADTPAAPAALRRGSGNGGGKGSGNGNGNHNRNRNGGGYGKRDGRCSTGGTGAMLRQGNGSGGSKGSGNGNGNGNRKRQRNRNGSGSNCTR